MSYIDKYFIRLFGKKVGEDQFGNEYFISIKKDYLGKRKRYVLYRGLNESSKVPPVWHAWLHYSIDELPDNNIENFAWQTRHQPNVTGTKHAYDPSNSSGKKLKLYEAWQPKIEK